MLASFLIASMIGLGVRRARSGACFETMIVSQSERVSLHDWRGGSQSLEMYFVIQPLRRVDVRDWSTVSGSAKWIAQSIFLLHFWSGVSNEGQFGSEVTKLRPSASASIMWSVRLSVVWLIMMLFFNNLFRVFWSLIIKGT